MKKLLILGIVGIFSFSSLANNESVENQLKMEEALVKEAADSPVYCDGVYAGNASTIAEAMGMCGL